MSPHETQPSVERPQLAAYIEEMIGELADMARAGGLANLAAMLSLTALEASRSRLALSAADQAAGQQLRVAG